MIRVVVLLAVLLFPAIARAQSAPHQDGLTHHWTLDESSGALIDSAGSQNGTAVGSPTYATVGVVDNAMGFDGSDDRITISTVSVGAEATFSVWAKITSSTDCSSNFSAMMTDDISGENGFYLAGGSCNFLCFKGDSSLNNEGVCGTVAGLDSYAWHHYVGVSTASGMYVYIDGQLLDSNTGSFTNVGVNGPYEIGHARTSGTRYFTGDLDDVRIYNRALSAAEIEALYQQRSNDPPVAGQIVYNVKHAAMHYCDGTQWRMMGTGPYNPNAIQFSDSVLRTDATGISDSKQGTLSYWFKFDDVTTGDDQLILYLTAAKFGMFLYDFSDKLTIQARNSSGTDILWIAASSFTPATDGWHHFMASWDLSDPDAVQDVSCNRCHIYIDGEDTGLDLTKFRDENIDYNPATPRYFIGGQNGGSVIEPFAGSLADIWFMPGTYIDLSVEANRRKFISESGMPMYFGPDGTIPTGEQPAFYLTGATDDWHNNKGYAGGMTKFNNDIATASSQPGDDVGQADGGDGYFVLIGNQPTNQESNEFDGDRGGLSGANATCLSFLQTYDWLGKADAVSRNLLYDGNVKAWLCDDSTCQDMMPDTDYAFATGQVSMSGNGGATFTTDANGLYPTADSNAWSGSTYFNRNTDFWTGRDSDFSPNTGFTCNDWTSNNGGDSGYLGNTDDNTSDRWNNTSDACNTTDQFVCFVNPVPELSGGCGTAGLIQYSSAFNVMEYCNGVEWVAMGPVGGTPPTNGLVGHWKLDETSGTLADSSGLGHDGTAGGNVTYASAGIVGNSMVMTARTARCRSPTMPILILLPKSRWRRGFIFPSTGVIRRLSIKRLMERPLATGCALSVMMMSLLRFMMGGPHHRMISWFKRGRKT